MYIIETLISGSNKNQPEMGGVTVGKVVELVLLVSFSVGVHGFVSGGAAPKVVEGIRNLSAQRLLFSSLATTSAHRRG